MYYYIWALHYIGAVEQMEYEFQDFNIENHNIIFGGNSEEDILLSIPFAEETPQCIMDKLNKLINQGMEEWASLGTWNGILEQAHMPKAEDLLLNARMQISYDHNLGVKYYIAITITDFHIKPDMTGICIDKDVVVNSSSELYNDFVAYCRYQLDKLLFPVT